MADDTPDDDIPHQPAEEAVDAGSEDEEDTEFRADSDATTEENEIVDDYREGIGQYKLLTKYEIASILGNRAEQIDRGAKPLVDISELSDVLKTATHPALIIARYELEHGKIPFKIGRRFPSGKGFKIVKVPVNKLVYDYTT